MLTKYTRNDIIITTFNSCDEATKARFKDWALSLKPELDGGEYGADENGVPYPNSAWLWVLEHNASAAFTSDSVYQTYIAIDKVTGEFLATGSIVPDDRDIAKKYHINSRGLWGFANVRRDLRGRGLGTLMFHHRDQEVQKFVDKLGEVCDFSFFTGNELTIRIGTPVGYHFVRQIHVEEFDADEDLYTKTYTPRS